MNVQLAGLPMLPWSSPPLSHDTQAGDIMSTPVVVVKEVEQVSEVVRLLKETWHEGFPVVQPSSHTSSGRVGYGTLRGLILRSQLKILLKERAFCPSASGAQASQRPVPLETFRLYYPRHPDLKDMTFTPEELSSYLDLRPYLNPTPYTVPVVKAYILSCHGNRLICLLSRFHDNRSRHSPRRSSSFAL